MKIGIAIFLIISIGINCTAQKVITGVSESKYINISKDPLKPPYLEVLINSLQYSDMQGNQIIDAGEVGFIRFELANSGTGPGLSLITKTRLLNEVDGLTFNTTVPVGILEPGKAKPIEIPVTGSMELQSGVAEFEIFIDEANGFDSDPVKIVFRTEAFRSPMIKIVDFQVSSQSGSTLQRKIPFELQVLVQNVGQGMASDVRIILPVAANIFCLSSNEELSIGQLKPGESKLVDYNFVTNAEYSLDMITFDFKLQETYGKYTEDRTISLQMNQSISNDRLVVEGNDYQTPTITVGSLSSLVDKNIPFNPDKNPNRYALIIGNENYSRYSTLNAEINVDFAINDARIFREYAINTLGLEERNVFSLFDATAGVMRGEMDRFTQLIQKIGSKAEIIFYYAGHGFPEEVTRTSYLIPIDVNSGNLEYAIKLSEMYNKLSATGAGRITVFLDACFSGGGRNEGLLSARGVVVRPNNEYFTGNMVVFAAASGQQSSLSNKKEKHGMFTYFLLKKVQETRGAFSYGELADYLKESVAIESLRENHKSQDPEVKASPLVELQWRQWSF